MLRFFRQIRKTLMEQNKVRSYFLYAIGEIFLVVIGILIALQVNNWNENRIARQSEKELLTEVMEAIRSDSLVILNTIGIINDTYQVYKTVYKIQSGILSEDSLKNINYIRRSIPVDPVSNDNYPNLASQIIDQKLKLRVFDYYQALKGWEFIIDNYNELIEHKVRPFLGEQQLLIYGSQYSELLSEDELVQINYNMINESALIKKLNTPEVQQVFFEATQKTLSAKGFIDRVMASQDTLKMEIQRVLN
tara:strand:+ start:28 stop:774 length:747 start_codon:yes stop_codon:yes gene_type:complete